MAAMDGRGPDAKAMRPVRFHMPDPDLGTFPGWTDDTFWNGWLNVEVDAPTHFEILGRIAADYGRGKALTHPALDTDAAYAVGLWEALSGLEQLSPNERGRYSYANCYCAREAMPSRT